MHVHAAASIKLYAWEYAFIRRILYVRNDLELKMLRKIGIATAMNTTLWSGIPCMCCRPWWSSSLIVQQ